MISDAPDRKIRTLSVRKAIRTACWHWSVTAWAECRTAVPRARSQSRRRRISSALPMTPISMQRRSARFCGNAHPMRTARSIRRPCAVRCAAEWVRHSSAPLRGTICSALSISAIHAPICSPKPGSSGSWSAIPLASSSLRAASTCPSAVRTSTPSAPAVACTASACTQRTLG